jgi:folate-dependent phosphoribosylglycinamide formyltransferase PurN
MRLGLLVGGGLTPFNRAVLADLEAASRHEIVCAVLDARPSLPLWARIKRHLRKGRGLYLGVMIVSELLREPDAPADAYCAARGIPLLSFTGYDDAAFAAKLARHAPDALVLLGGFGILKKPLLELAPRGVLSYHHGDMRRYRGQPPAFWEVCHGETAMGVTVQLLCEQLDAGLPVAETSVPIGPGESLDSVTRRAFAKSVPLMREALDKVAAGAPLAPLEILGTVYTLPNLRQWLVCHWRILLRHMVVGGKCQG